MRTGILLIGVLGIIAIYAFTSSTALLSGSHTMEFNATGRIESLDCPACHAYALDELNSTVNSRSVLQAHLNAAGNRSYTGGWLNLVLENGTSPLPRYVAACQMCHLAQVSINYSHTQALVRVCTDLDCHGSNETTNNTAYSAAGNVGPVLGGGNVHGDWFVGMSESLSDYRNETLVNYTQGYYACLGCHTPINVNINVSKWTFNHDDASATKRRYI